MPALPRLTPASLSAMPADIQRPAYDRTVLVDGIVHLGLGAFHRAHQAAFTDTVLAHGPTDRRWGIVGVSLRSPAVRDALAPQHGLFTLATAAVPARYRIIGAVRACLVAPEDPGGLVARLAASETRIVSLTITEKGYCRDPATGGLALDHPDVAWDLARPQAPCSALGFVVAALRARRSAGRAPFTVLSCDNLPDNGGTLRRLVVALAAETDPDLAAWIEHAVPFPSTMVDSIVPATTEALRDRVRTDLGVEDAWPVAREPFAQWVIEDRFAAARPAWELAGAHLVGDVAPYELMKLRLLNGSHSALAYLGALAGHAHVHDVLADPSFRTFLADLMCLELAPTVPAPPGVDLAAYQAALLDRFANPAVLHRTTQIAMDGTQKLPVRLLPCVRERLARGQPVDRIGLAVAGWMRFVVGCDDQREPLPLQDPLADKLSAAVARAGRNAEGLADALLGLPDVFGTDLPHATPFTRAVKSALRSLADHGAAATVARAVGGKTGKVIS